MFLYLISLFNGKIYKETSHFAYPDKGVCCAEKLLKMKTDTEKERDARLWWEGEKGELSFPHHIREIEKALNTNNSPEILFGFLLGDLGNLDYMAERYGSLAPAALHELRKSWQERFVQYVNQKPKLIAELGVKALEEHRDSYVRLPNRTIGYTLAYLNYPDNHKSALLNFSFSDGLERLITLGRMDESYKRYIRPNTTQLPTLEERRQKIEEFYRDLLTKITSFNLMDQKYKDAHELFNEQGLIQL